MSKTEKIVLFIGNLLPSKGICDLLNAAQILDKRDAPGIRFILIGEGRSQKTAIELAKKLKKIRLDTKGNICHSELNTWINASDLVCLPSHNEGCPNVILESFACGTPVVASRVGGIPELVKEFESGILFEPKSPYALADCIEKALKTEWDRFKITQSINDKSWDNVAKKINHECEILCATKGNKNEL